MKLHKYLKCDPDKREFNHSIKLDDTEVTQMPDNMTINGSLSVENCKLTTLPKNLTVKNYLFAEGFAGEYLPEGLVVGKNMWIDGSNIKHLPKDIKIKGFLNIGSNIKSWEHPVVYGCGTSNRTIFLCPHDFNLIQIGCFVGTKDQAITAVQKRYRYTPDQMEEYIQKIELCFSMANQYKQAA